jgi:hypothetical protein
VHELDNIQIDTTELKKIRSLVDSIENYKDYKSRVYENVILELTGGEYVVKIEKHEFENLAKYTLYTDRVSRNIDVKSIDLYLCNDSLIQAVVYYTDDRIAERKSRLKKTIYYKNSNFIFEFSGIRILLHENYQEYIEIAKKLVKIRQY